MKKIKKLTVLLIIAFIGFTSCSSDEYFISKYESKNTSLNKVDIVDTSNPNTISNTTLICQNNSNGAYIEQDENGNYFLQTFYGDMNEYSNLPIPMSLTETHDWCFQNDPSCSRYKLTTIKK